MAYSAAGIYGGATFIGLVEDVIPGGQSFSPGPALAALALTLLIVVLGPRLPRRVIALFGPVGAVLIGVALAATREYGDGGVLYMLPVVWMAYFFGTSGTIFIVGWVGVVHAGALLAMPAGHANLDRWIDVEVAVLVVAVVVRALAARNERLVDGLVAEARVDRLTGLLNRRGFEERAATELARAARDDAWLGVATFDLDHFKAVNDEHGHEVGDRVLTWLGSVIVEQVRNTDVAARVGGEEFVVLLPGADAGAAQALAERVRVAVAVGAAQRGRFAIPSEVVPTVSGGTVAAVAPLDLETLLDAADHALYAAKRGGRNRVVAAPGVPELVAS